MSRMIRELFVNVEARSDGGHDFRTITVEHFKGKHSHSRLLVVLATLALAALAVVLTIK